MTTHSGRGLRGPALAGLLAILIVSPGCGHRDLRPVEREAGWVTSARIDGSPGTGSLRFRLSGNGVARGWPWFPHFSLTRTGTDAKLDPRLKKWLASHPDTSFAEILVEYTDPVEMPAFPIGQSAIFGFAPGDSIAAIAARAIADSLTQLRAAWYGLERARLASQFGATLVDSFWLTRSVVARMRLGDVRRLAGRHNVEFVQLAHRGGPAPFDCSTLAPLENRDALVGDGRALLNSDPLRSLGYGHGKLSLLDTGVWTGHKLLLGPAASAAPLGPALTALDCVGSPGCNGTKPMDTNVSPGGHGTIVCGLLVGDDAMGECLRGLTEARVESHRVYEEDPEMLDQGYHVGIVDPAAYKHACEKVIVQCTPVAVLEVADAQGPYGPYSRTAGRVYQAGVAVVAAAGNGYNGASGTGSWIGSPGDHPWVISVGGRKTKTPSETLENQSRGRVGYRYKPDLQAPSATTSASLSGPQELRNLGGTSGATPYAGASALLLRNWLASTSSSTPPGLGPAPGHAYAAMLATGDVLRRKSTPKIFPAATGAGLLHLPSTGRGWWGNLLMGSLTSKEIPLDVIDPDLRQIRAAIWWPDPVPSARAWLGLGVIQHLDFDLELVKPNGQVLASSAGTRGVFERLEWRTKGSAPPGPLKLRVISKSVGVSTKPVYFAVMAEP
jgi:hypothetical protein